MTPPLTICTRCGDLAPASPKDAQFCQVCLPDPAVAAQKAWDATSRHHEAVQAAAQLDGRPPPPAPKALRPPGGPRHPRGDAAANVAANLDAARSSTKRLGDTAYWMIAPSWGAAHLFVGTNLRSACGKVRAEKGRAAPHGLRGCRACALSLRLIESRSEVVTT